MNETNFDLLIDEKEAKDFIVEHTGCLGDPGYAWMTRTSDRSMIEGIIRGEILIVRAALDLLREAVESAHDEDGVAWDAIADALDMPADTVALIYGGAVNDA